MTASRVEPDRGGPVGRLNTEAQVGASGRRVAKAACAALLAVEVLGSLLMWAPIPLAWIWVGARVYDATGSLMAYGGVALLGFLATAVLDLAVLTRIDRVWVALRRRSGYEQAEGALTDVVAVSATFGILMFLIWYYLIGQAYLIPFMPSQ